MTSAASPTSATLSPRGRRESEESEALFEIILKRSFGRGEITLSSGKKSDFYFDMKPSMLDPAGAFLMAKLLLGSVSAAGGEYVGGLEMGAVPITGAICAYSHSVERPVSGFFVRKAVKEHGAKKQVEGFMKDEKLTGKKLVIIEDVTTSGASALKAVEACRAAGADVRLVISIVDRSEGAAEAFAQAGVPFKSLFRAQQFLDRSA
jgi:orotate phosphoribosyltransferase